jgi:DGQHR domain-containing protein
MEANSNGETFLKTVMVLTDGDGRLQLANFKEYPARLFWQGGRFHVTFVATFPALRGLTVAADLIKASEAREMGIGDVAQLWERPLDKPHAEDIKNYLMNNEDYVLGTITLNVTNTVDVKVAIKRSDLSGIEYTTNKTATVYLYVRDGALLQIADGQHRKLGIALALNEDQERFRSESILLDLILEGDIVKAHQDFVDMNANVKPMAKSITTVFDTRGTVNKLTVDLYRGVSGFGDANVEALVTSISKNSAKIYTINNMRNAVVEYLTGKSQSSLRFAERELADKYPVDKLDCDSVTKAAYDALVADCTGFFELMSATIKPWNDVIKLGSKRKASEVRPIREDNVCLSGVGLIVLARAGFFIKRGDQSRINDRLRLLGTIDWSRSNKMWQEAGLVTGGKITSNRSTILAAADAVLAAVGITTPKEEEAGACPAPNP